MARSDSAQLALGLPIAIAGIYLVRLAQTFQERLTVVGGDSDAIIHLVIAATMDEVPDGQINNSTFGHYEIFAWTRATEWLPFYREVWEAIPEVLWMASLGVVVWAAWRSVGKWAAVLTGVIGLCVSPYLLYILFAPSFHPLTLYSSAVAVGLLVYLTTRARLDVRAWIVAVAATLLLGGAIAADRLVLVAAIGPFLFAGAGVALRHPARHGRKIALAVGLVAAGALAIAKGITAIMEASDFVTTPRTEAFEEAGLIFDKVSWFLQEALWMFNAHFLGRGLSFESALSFVVAVGAVVALIAPFVVLRRRLRDNDVVVSPQELGRSAYVFFWAATMAVVPTAVVFSDADVFAHYFLPVLFAAAATVPLLARSVGTRFLVVAGVSTYAVLGVVNLDVRAKDGDLESHAARVATQANQLASIARQEQAYVGYAGYWEAGALSWSTKLQVKVFPIAHTATSCSPPDGTPCPFPINRHEGWYVARDGIRSFLIGPTPEGAPHPSIARTEPPTVFAESYEPPESFGPPLSTHRLFNGAELYVYPYDIAARFNAPVGVLPQ
jgi:hypothetical protein